MTKKPVSELTGAELDYWVARADEENIRRSYRHQDFFKGIERKSDGGVVIVEKYPDMDREVPFEPSTDWEDGGPIIEREKISVLVGWQASMRVTLTFKDSFGNESRVGCSYFDNGSTPLEAAMRCFVKSKFG
jgi:hypothetical protein